MRGRFRKFVLLLALSALPLQGLAANLAALLVCDRALERSAQLVVAPADHDRGGQLDRASDESGAADHAEYPCCHGVVSGLPVATPPAAPGELSVAASVPQPLPDLFFPDRLQRPPLA